MTSCDQRGASEHRPQRPRRAPRHLLQWKRLPKRRGRSHGADTQQRRKSSYSPTSTLKVRCPLCPAPYRRLSVPPIVVHRTRQFEESLAQILESFRNHHEGQVLRVPKLVRNITMAEFADKYNGDINECLRGVQRQRHGGEPTLDSSLKKRKWKDSDDVPGPEDAESSRASKTGTSSASIVSVYLLYLLTLFPSSHRISCKDGCGEDTESTS